MSYLDRLKECVYTSPSGKSFNLKFDSVSEGGGHKAVITELPMKNGAVIQDLGATARTFPLTVYIDGQDYDTLADSFKAALNERGVAQLQHPTYGNLNVICTSYEDSRSFVEDMGRAVFTLQLTEDIGVQGLQTFMQTVQAAASAAADVQKAVIQAASALPAQTVAQKTLAKSSFSRWIDTIEEKLCMIVSASSELKSKISNGTGNLRRNLSEYIDNPGALVSKLSDVFDIPVTLGGSVKDNILKYYSLATALKDSVKSYGLLSDALQAYSLELSFCSAVKSLENGDIETRTDAVYIRGRLFSYLADIKTSLSELDYEEDAETAILIQNTYNSASAFLMSTVLDLPMEQVYTTDQDENAVTLAFKLYGSSEYMDKIADDNNLGGDLIFNVPAGTKIKYYV